jgi:glycosyltransferase involved in cell wall biosynthesis
MRVGIRLPVLPESFGGGFRFEHEILQGLLDRLPSSAHEFVLIGDEATWSQESELPPNAVYATLYPSYPHEPLFLHAIRWARRTKGWDSVRRLHAWFKPPPAVPVARELLRAHGVQFLVQLGPWALNLDVPFLTFVWDLAHRCQPYFPELSANGEWESRNHRYQSTLPRATVVVTGTQEGKNQIERFYGVSPDRIAILPHPTPSDALALAARTSEAGLPHGSSTEPTLLYPAQFWPHKNHVGLFKALRLLNSRHGLRPRLLLTGSDQGNRGHAEQMARELRVADQISILGFVPRDDLLQLYRQVSALVYPSTFGPENLPPLEAFALGCPVAASRIPGSEEQLGDAAVFFDPHDHGAMADAIRAVLVDPSLRATLIERGRARAKRWTRTDVADAILGCLDQFTTVRDLWP